MKLIPIISMFTGWIGAGLLWELIGGVGGAVIGLPLFLCVTMAHDGLLRDRR